LIGLASFVFFQILGGIKKWLFYFSFWIIDGIIQRILRNGECFKVTLYRRIKMKRKIMRRTSVVLILAFAVLTTANAQELKLEILNGHSGGGVLAVAVSNDGKFALTGSADQTALLWDLETGKQLRRFFGYHEDAVSCVQFSKDGRFVLTASYDSSAQLWETTTGRRVHGFGENRSGVLVKHSGKILSCAISADMKLVATAGEDKTARIWDFETGKQIHQINHTGRVNSIAFSPDSRFLLTGGEDEIARLLSTATGKEIRQFVGHNTEIMSVDYSPDGEKVLTGGFDDTVRLWNAETGQEIRKFHLDTSQEIKWFFSEEDQIRDVAFTPSGNAVIATRKFYGASLWEISTGNIIWNTDKYVKISIAFTLEGKLILGNNDNFIVNPIRILDISKNEEVKELDGKSGLVSSLAISPNFQNVLTGGSMDTSGLWNLPTGKLDQWWREKNMVRKKGSKTDKVNFIETYNKIVISPNGKTIAEIVTISGYPKSNLEKNTVHSFFEIYDLNSKTLLFSKDEQDVWIRSAVFSQDGNFLLVAGEMEKKVPNIRLYNSKSGIKEIEIPFKDDFILTDITLAPDNNLIAISTLKNIYLWDISRKSFIWSSKSNPNSRRTSIWDIVFSPDGKTLATAGGGEADMSKIGIGDAARANSVQFWEVETGKEIGSFGGDLKIANNKIPGFKSVAYSPDGKFVAAGSLDDEVYLFNTETRELRQFEGHTDAVNSVKFAKDANGNLLVVSGSSDSTTRIWNAVTGEEICALVTFRDGNWAVVQTKTGRYDAPNGGKIEGIQWVFGNEQIELKQLSAMYYTPNLLPRLLGYNKDPLPSVVPLKDVKLYPEVVEQKFDAQTGKLNFKLKARNGGIGKTEVYVAGKLKDRLGNTTETEKLVVADARDERLKQNPFVPPGEIVSLSVELPPNSFVAGGENQIKVVTSNYLKEIGKGNIQSRGTEIVHLDGGKTDLQMPTLYAIIGGTSDYAGDGLDLRFAAKDAEDFANALQLGAKRLFGVDKVNITTLSTNREKPEEQPTKENFRRAVAEIARKAKPEDIFLLYLAGHGVTLGTGTDTYFYLTKEARSTVKTDLEANFQTVAVSNAEMMDWLTPDSKNPNDLFIQARKQVIILDTCAAGNFAREEWKKDREGLTGDQIRAMEFLEKKTGTFVLMGSAANAVSYEANNYNQGLLTYSLLEGMKGFALQKPTENVDVRLLFDYAEKRVETLAKGLGLEQRPLIKQPSGNTFVIGQMTDTEKQKIELAKEKPLMLRQSLGMLPRNNDPLGLTNQLRKAFDAESSYAVVRQRGEREPPLIYIDDDSLPNAVQVTGTYTVEGEKVKVKAYLIKGNKEIAALEVSEVKAEVIKKLLRLIRAELVKLN
jgi:WD40 repeat protein/uncharacterized caspase-like protein